MTTFIRDTREILIEEIYSAMCLFTKRVSLYWHGANTFSVVVDYCDTNRAEVEVNYFSTYEGARDLFNWYAEEAINFYPHIVEEAPETFGNVWVA